MTDFTLSDFSDRVADLADAAAPSLASIRIDRRMTVSAFHWRDGFYVTAEELSGHDDEIELTLASGDAVKAEVAGRDPSTGIALLKTGRSGVPVLSRANPVRIGGLVVAAGHGGESPIAAVGTAGEVGAAWRSRRGGVIDRRINLSMMIGPRFEGAAALDASGGLIGMILFGPRRRALVIPTETIDRVAPALVDQGYVARGYLGAGLHPVRRGDGWAAMVMSLDEDGPAKKAGLHQGDIIVTWNGEAVEGVRWIMRRLGAETVGTTVSLGLMRGGTEQAVEITIGARPRS